jgi:hypothetical protein
MVNRGVLIVRPKQPYLDWANELDDSGVLPDANGEQTVYLIPRFETDEEALSILKQVYAEVFENELYGWHTDEDAWPQERTFTMFKKWFAIEMHSVVEDLDHDEDLYDEEA